MLFSLCYFLVRCVLGLAVWRWRPNGHQELEIAVLRHELAILRRQRQRPVMTTRPAVPDNGEPLSAERSLAFLHHHAL